METYRVIARDSDSGRILDIWEWTRPGSTWTAARVKRWLRRFHPSARIETLRVRGAFD